jgi:transketolase
VRADWNERFEAFEKEHPELAARFTAGQRGELPDDWQDALPHFDAGKALATRASSGATINALAPVITNLIGGSADLAESNNTDIKGGGSISRDNPGGRNIHFGVREHAMGSMMNGMSLHGGVRPFGGTFLIFSDYMRPSIRLAALLEQPVTYTFTHDSIGLGEDGPTHQPIEQLMSLRLIPNLQVIRPADAAETAMAWRMALERKRGPTALVLTRQKLTTFDRSGSSGFASEDGVLRGGYTLLDAELDGRAVSPAVVLIGTGSEVHVCIAARDLLAGEGIGARVVSMPCVTEFESQSDSYRESVLPAFVTARVVVEAGATRGWGHITGPHGAVVGLDRFGASAPGERVMEELGFTADHVASVARASMARVSDEADATTSR